MIFFELEPADISTLNDGELRELVARLCEAELIQQGIHPSSVTWGGAQEAADGGLDVCIMSTADLPNPGFVPRKNTGFQVKKHSMGKSACQKEMQENGKPKAIIEDLTSRNGSYIIVSGKDDCTGRMLSDRLSGMENAVDALQGKSNLHLNFYGRDRLSAWLRRHPSVALWVRSRLGKPLAGWKPYCRWAATPSDQDDEFLIDGHPCVIVANSSSKEPKPIWEGIQLTRDRLRKFGSTVRIIGLSGVGKTRFAQALFEAKVGFDALPESDVIYADLGNDLTPTASELVTYLIGNDFAPCLVLDNCPPDVHRNLQKQVAASGAKLRLLTIEYDISEDKPEETEVIYLEPTSEETVSRLVQKRFRDLGRVNADRLAEFAGGNARLALALASRVNVDETLSNFSDEDLFRRLFSQRKGDSPELLSSAEALALVYSFNVASEECDELGVLGTIAGLTRKNLYRDQAELLRRHLAQQRGSWRAILPHALANRLAKRAFQNIPFGDINAELFKFENVRLFQSCAHRLGYLHDFDRAQELALTWVRPGAPLSNIAACSDEYLKALEYVAPVFPDVVLRSIEQASADPAFTSRENKSIPRFVRILCRLAYERESFDRAAEVLLKFAETENVDVNSNSIVLEMQKLFSFCVSGTEATPEQRQVFVMKLLNSGNQRQREIAKELLSSAFRSHESVSFGLFHFGARKRGPGWCPKSRDDRTGWYVGFIQSLQPTLSSVQESDRDWAKSVLASHFRELWSYARCFDSLEQIIRNHGRDGNWVEIWVSIQKTLHYDGDGYAPELLARLESLEKLTAPSDPYSKIRAYVLAEPVDYIDIRDGGYQVKEDEIRKKVVKLGELAACKMEYLDRLGAKLWETRVRPISWFGKGLAVGSSDRLSMFNHLVESLEKHQSNQSSICLLEGYVEGANELDSLQARQILERALDIPKLKAYSVSLLVAAPIATWTLEKLLELARGGEIEAWHFDQISYGGVHEVFSDNDLTVLLTEINSLDGGYLSTIQILSMRFWGKERHEYIPSEELCVVAREAVRRLFLAHRGDLNQVELHGIDRVLDEAFNTSAPESEIREIIDLLCERIRTYSLPVFSMTKVITTLVKKFPELFLNVVFDCRKNKRSFAIFLFRGYESSEDSILNDAPLDRVMAWCGKDQERITMVAEAMHAYCGSDPAAPPDGIPKRLILSEHINSLLEAATDKLAIVEIIFKDIDPGSLPGSSLADILEVRSKAFAELLEYPDTEVQELVKAKLSSLEKRIHNERTKKAVEHNEHEQRFE